MAQILADSLSTLGFHIVSGLARGIDTAAHHASISGGTIAVLGGGVDDIYPEENKGLYESLLCQGLILSESPVGHRAQAKDFPRRNRLIAALSLATVVVEAELRSGSLITARLAIEHNREVFAVPGSPLDPRARGCNELLRRGAYLCENAQDIVSILEPIMGFSEPATGASFVSPPQKIYDDEVALDDEISQLIPKILGLLSHTPSARDDILRLCGGRTVAAMAAISELEMTGFIDVHAGGTLSRIA
jgi:DNA processing protein